ncbi:MAG: hypothetical protein JSU83_20060 [Deltaproteobacteria bacterium]|nr:MAG: hypothetical protein JSU83_20060 [Deltaproteobacteria bacterium]
MKKTYYLKLGIIAGLLLFAVSHAEVRAPKNPKSAKACAICHYRWVDTFFIEGKDSDLVPYQSEKVVAKPDMCMSCHDGSVMDSRARVNKDSGHRTNIPPPAGMRIPAIFPLDDNGKMQCATCHTAHGVPSGTGHETTIFLRTSNKDSAMCRKCHPGRDSKSDPANHPIGQIEREIPVKLLAMSTATGKKNDKITCETCHIAHGSSNEGHLIRSGRNSGICLDCHRDKNNFTPDGKKKPYHVFNVKPLNATIPDHLLDQGAKVGHKKEVICQTCHKVHRSQNGQNLLLVKQDTKSTLCLTCHADKQYITTTKHNLIHSAPNEKNLQGHTVTETGACSACHLPHKAARKLDGKSDFTSQMCLSCHGKGNMAEKENLQGNSHPLNLNPFEKNSNGPFYTVADVQSENLKLPLFNKYGIQDNNGKMTCSTCHNPHRWRANSPVGEIRKNVKGDRTSSFLRIRSPEICRECHSGKFRIADSEHNMDKVAPKETNTLNKSPAESGVCGTCHLVHGGHKNFLWARELSDTGKNGTQHLCLSCHKKNGPAKKKIIKEYSHPLNISPAEKSLLTTLPLFDDDGKSSKDGFITCSTCHDPHRWDPSKNLTEDQHDKEGNSQNSFLRLKNSPSSKLCENCHRDKALIEKTDHDLTVTAPVSKNKLGQRPAESGTCGVCHGVHNSRNKTSLWVQGLGRGNHLGERMCRNCHSKSGSAADKKPQIYFHPDDFAIINPGRNIKNRPGYFPLFDAVSGTAATSGGISCPSCHNIHQWSPLSPEKGTGDNPEGDVSNSFLRNLSYKTICIDCHGPDALFRYQYFHFPEKR